MAPVEIRGIVQPVLDDLIGGVQAALGSDRVTGAYLYGSVVSGGFDERNSDIDILVVVEQQLTHGDVERLGLLHRELVVRHPSWDDRIEVQYFPRQGLAEFKERSCGIAVISPGEPFHRIVAGPDWLQNWFDVQENGQTLLGPPAASVIPSISRDEFIAAIKVYATEIRDRTRSRTHPIRGAVAYAVLTMCRALYSCETGEQVSKADAAMWAQTRLPEWAPLIAYSMGIRQGERLVQYLDGTADRETALPFVEAVASLIGLD
jgi:hypothetical protein